MVGIQEWRGARALSVDGVSGAGRTMDADEVGRATEATLLRAGQAGDHAALEQLLALHQRPLFRLCHGMLGHAEDAEDAAQETFLRALRALPAFRGDSAFRTWLFRIAVNVCLKWKGSRRPTEPWDEEHALLSHHSPSPEAIALDQLRIKEALGSLPVRYRVILLLKVLEGWSVTEIAAVMRWNPVKVQNELAAARRALVEWRRRETSEGEGR